MGVFGMSRGCAVTAGFGVREIGRVTAAAGFVGSAPRWECSRSKPLWKQKSSQHLDGNGIRISTSGRNGSRVSTSTGTVSESAPRAETEVESAPQLERCPNQHLGRKRKSSQHLDRNGIRVSTSEGNGSRVSTSTVTVSESAPRKAEVESAPRPEGSRFRVNTSKCQESGLALESAPRAPGKDWSRLSKFAGLYTPERPVVRPGSAWGAVVCALRYVPTQVCSRTRTV